MLISPIIWYTYRCCGYFCHVWFLMPYSHYYRPIHGYLVGSMLTHWGRVTHICVSNLTIIGPDNGLSSDRRQAIIWTNDGIFLVGPLGTNFSEILIKISTFSFNKMRLKVSSVKQRPFCLGLNVLNMVFFSPYKDIPHKATCGLPIISETPPSGRGQASVLRQPAVPFLRIPQSS